MKFKIGDKVKQTSHVHVTDKSPYAVVTRVEKGLIYHKHDESGHTGNCDEKDFILIFRPEQTFEDIIEIEVNRIKGG